MQLQNFECQIAKAQIGRYIAGDSLSAEAIEQLEAHVAKCADCKQNLAERRAVLMAMLSPVETTETTTTKATPPRGFDVTQFIKSKLHSKSPVTAAAHVDPAKQTQFTKPALYSLALGAVLIGMSYASKNMGSVLGPKATEQLTADVPESTAPDAVNLSPIGAAISTSLIEQAQLPLSEPPAPQPYPAKINTNDLTVEPVTNASTKHMAPRRPSNTIRVYAPEN
jgi:hypothetical protein